LIDCLLKTYISRDIIDLSSFLCEEFQEVDEFCLGYEFLASLVDESIILEHGFSMGELRTCDAFLRDAA
jgi:hypothetical protein